MKEQNFSMTGITKFNRAICFFTFFPIDSAPLLVGVPLAEIIPVNLKQLTLT
jgi:hypothetical protein